MDARTEPIEDRTVDRLGLTAQLVAAYVARNHVTASNLPGLIAETHAALSGLGSARGAAACVVKHPTPDQICASITPDALISFEDGKPYKILKRHLRVHGLSFEAYRRKWGLPNDYPMTAPSYSARRSAIARTFRLGRLPTVASAETQTASNPSGTPTPPDLPETVRP